MTESEKLRSRGCNCAQSTLAALRRYTGLDEETALAVASGFGGGMRTGEVCGAVSGAVMALGLAKNGADLSSKNEITALTTEFIRRFKAEYGAVPCRELLAKTAPKRRCEEYIEYCARLAQELLDEKVGEMKK